MENTINGRGIADMTHFKLQVKILLKTINFHSEGWAVWEMVHDSVDITQVNWRREKFHVLLVVREVSDINT